VPGVIEPDLTALASVRLPVQHTTGRTALLGWRSQWAREGEPVLVLWVADERDLQGHAAGAAVDDALCMIQ